MSRQVTQNTISGLAFVLLAVLIIWVAIPYGVQEPKKLKFVALSPSYYPRLVACCLLFFGFLLLLRQLIARRAAQTAPQSESVRAHALGLLALVIAVLLGYYWFLASLGFVLSSILALLALLLLAGERKPVALILISIGVPTALYLFFTKVANIPIPGGVLDPFLLGI